MKSKTYKNRRSRGACNYCGNVQWGNMKKVEYFSYVLRIMMQNIGDVNSVKALAKFPCSPIVHYTCSFNVCSPLSRDQKGSKKACSLTLVVLFLLLFSVSIDLHAY